MITTLPLQKPNALRDTVSTAFLMLASACLFTTDLIASGALLPYSKTILSQIETSSAKRDLLDTLPQFLTTVEELNIILDRFYNRPLQVKVVDALEIKFRLSEALLSQILALLKPYRGSSELGADGGDRLLVAIAEARYKADRNLHQIRQASTPSKTYISAIDPNGLVALAKQGRTVATNYSS